MTPDLSVRLGPLALANPVMTASGTCGYGLELERWTDLAGLGAIVLKGLSLEPRAGNQPPRTVETAAGLLNSIGLANVGVRRFVAEILPLLREKRATLVANVYATCADDFVAVARILEEAGGIGALELNLSCPNVKAGGIAFGQEPALTASLVEKVRRAVALPLIVKLTPRVADIAIPARASRDAGADALTVANTFPGMAIDWQSRRPVLGANAGGLSGPAIKPLALKLVWEACQAVDLPVIGCGGISTAEDAAEFIVAGATAVQVGTAVLADPTAAARIRDGLAGLLAAGNLASVGQLRGTLCLNES